MVCKAVLFASVIVILCAQFNAEISDCGSVTGSTVSIEVSNCKPTARRCILKRNTDASIEVTFNSKVASNNVTAVVHGVILGVPVPFDLPDPNACKAGIACPIQAGQTYKYSAKLPIQPSYPRVTVDVKWELQDDAGTDIFCILIPSKIQ